MKRKIKAELIILLKQRQLLADSLIFYEESSLILKSIPMLSKEMEREKCRRSILRIIESISKTISSLISVLSVKNVFRREEIITELWGEEEIIRKNAKFIIETHSTTKNNNKLILEVREGEFPLLNLFLTMIE